MQKPTIRLGTTGAPVALWQRAIGISVDGVFGRQTETATKAWQQRHGLLADGIVGPKTWATVIDPNAPAAVLQPLVRGTDVSAIQGDLTDKDWKAMKALGVDFAYMRLAVGNETWVDGRAKVNAQRAKDNGIVPGYYLFPYPLPHLDPKKQVERFVKLLEGMGTNPGELPPMFDLEWPPPEEWTKWKCSPEQLQDWGLTALDRGEELTGVDWIVYMYRWWIKMAKIATAPEFGKRRLALADYKYKGLWPSSEQIDNLVVPGPWPKEQLLIVQHDGDGGLKMPNGRDADFDVMVGGPPALMKHSRGAFGPSLTLPQSEPKMSTIPMPDLTGAIHAEEVPILDADISAYRRQRVDISG